MWFRLVCQINGHRLKSCLWHVEGLPGALAGLLSPDAHEASSMLEWLKEAWGCFQAASRVPLP
eukprot:2506135-Prorocentrum_lima.AAC.1